MILFELFFVCRFKEFFLRKKKQICAKVALCVVFFFFSEKWIDQEYLLCLNLCAVLKSFEFFLFDEFFVCVAR